MAHTISSINSSASFVVQLVMNEEITISHAMKKLIKLSLKSETVGDLDSIRIAREKIEAMAEKMGNHSTVIHENV